MAKPVLVLVHGSWHCPAHYKKLEDRLIKHGYRVETVLHPSSHAKEDRASKTISDDVEAVQQVTNKVLDGGDNVLFVCHSYGGVLCFLACEGLSTKDRQAAGKTTSVVGMVNIAGAIAPPGVTGKQLFNGEMPTPCQIADGLSFPKNPVEVFYHDIPEDEAKHAASLLSNQSVAIYDWVFPDMFSPVKDVPVYYLVCLQDRANVLEASKQIVGGIKAAGISIHARSVDTGHSPWYTKTDEVAELVRLAAGENVEDKLERFEV